MVEWWNDLPVSIGVAFIFSSIPKMFNLSVASFLHKLKKHLHKAAIVNDAILYWFIDFLKDATSQDMSLCAVSKYLPLVRNLKILTIKKITFPLSSILFLNIPHCLIYTNVRCNKIYKLLSLAVISLKQQIIQQTQTIMSKILGMGVNLIWLNPSPLLPFQKRLVSPLMHTGKARID